MSENNWQKSQDIIWTVNSTPHVQADINVIINYIAERDGRKRAREVLHQLLEKEENLASLSFRGHFPPELTRLHIHEFREIHCGVYRIFYQIIENERRVEVVAILDGRRDIDDLLQIRLLRISP